MPPKKKTAKKTKKATAKATAKARVKTAHEMRLEAAGIPTEAQLAASAEARLATSEAARLGEEAAESGGLSEALKGVAEDQVAAGEREAQQVRLRGQELVIQGLAPATGTVAVTGPVPAKTTLSFTPSAAAVPDEVPIEIKFHTTKREIGLSELAKNAQDMLGTLAQQEVFAGRPLVTPEPPHFEIRGGDEGWKWYLVDDYGTIVAEQDSKGGSWEGARADISLKAEGLGADSAPTYTVKTKAGDAAPPPRGTFGVLPRKGEVKTP